jgi:hypothetical protein
LFSLISLAGSIQAYKPIEYLTRLLILPNTPVKAYWKLSEEEILYDETCPQAHAMPPRYPY